MTTILNSNFLQSLDAVQNLLFWFGIFSSALFLVQILLLLVPSSSFTLLNKQEPPVFSEKTITAFLAAGSWAGFAASFWTDSLWIVIPVAIITGALAFVAAAFLVKFIFKTQKTNFQNKFSGADAVVTLKIPPERKGNGKIVLLVKDSYEKLDAITDEKESIPVGTPVRILEYTDDYALVCRLEMTKIGNPQAKIKREEQTERSAETNMHNSNGEK